MDLNIQTFQVDMEQGALLSLRILIPPNLPQVAQRDKIMTRIECAIDGAIVAPEQLDPQKSYALEPASVLACMLLENWCSGPISSFMQLTRDQFSQLLQPLQDQPVVFYLKNPKQALPWKNGKIAGVHDYIIVEKKEPQSEASPKPSTRNQPAKRSRFQDSEEFDLTPMTVDGSTQFLAITLPSRQSVLYQDALDLVKSHRFKLEPSNRKWWLRDRHQTLSFLSEYWADLKEKFRAQFTESFEQRTRQIQFADISLQTKETGMGFEVSLDLDVGDIDSNELHHTLNKGQNYVESGNRIVIIDKAKLTELSQAQQSISGEKDRALSPHFRKTISHAELAHAEEALESLSLATETPETWKNRSQALKQLDRLAQPPMDTELNEMLRPYQRMGVAWLWHLFQNKLGGVLADEMGLGKTIQALGLFTCIRNSNTKKQISGLIICPASLVENWRREITKFAPSLRAYAHHGSKRIKDAAELANVDLTITSYGTLTRDAKLFSEHCFDCIVADEAQHIKNRQTQNAKALRRLNAEGRFLLTGTPIENSLEDLYALFEFLMPGYLKKAPTGTKPEDRRWYQNRMRDQVVHYILRRSKESVAPELPEKIEQIVYCPMEGKQEKLYTTTQVKTQQDIFNMEMSNTPEGKLRLAALQQLLRLRQICAEPRILDETLKSGDSAKFRAFKEILEESIDGGHRILVFSQFVSVLTILRQELESEDIPYCYLDGQTKNRLAECDRFNDDDSIPVFLISLKAGGTGLNLTGADTVIHYDPWWNPAVEAQATDRAHRIGQKKVVTSIKLIAANTVEEKVVTLQKEKAQLLKDLLDASDVVNAKIDLEDIKAILKSL